MKKNYFKVVTIYSEKHISIKKACKVFYVEFATLVWNLNTFRASGAENFAHKAKYYFNNILKEEEELI